MRHDCRQDACILPIDSVCLVVNQVIVEQMIILSFLDIPARPEQIHLIINHLTIRQFV